MKRIRGVVVAGAAGLVAAGVLPVQSAVAEQPLVSVSDARCEQGSGGSLDWRAQAVRVVAGEDAGVLCHVDYAGGPQGASMVKLGLTISAQSIAQSGYSAAQLAQRLSVRYFLENQSVMQTATRWVVNPDGSMTLDLPLTSFPYLSDPSQPASHTMMDLWISGAPTVNSVLLQGQLELTAKEMTGKVTTPVAIDYVGNGRAADLAAPSTFVPLDPARLLDTRAGIGAAKGKVGPDGTLTLQVAGRAGIPADGVSAVVLNVTATGPTAESYVSVYPHGRQRPTASNLNFTPWETIPNQVTVPVVDGKVNLYNHVGSVDLVADVSGYYTPGTTGARYTPLVTPQRLLDTRNGTGARSGKLGPDSALTLPIGGTGGLPWTGVKAVILNVTVTNPTEESYVTAYPSGTNRPTASNLNFTPGRTISNQVIVPVVNGGIDLYNHVGSVDLVADIAGYFSYSDTGSVFVPAGPVRVLDSRDGTGGFYHPVPENSGYQVTVESWRYGLPPYGVTAVALNVTATNTTDSSFVTLYSAGWPSQVPATSTLNYRAGETIPNAATPGAGYGVVFASHIGRLDLVADLDGYFLTY